MSDSGRKVCFEKAKYIVYEPYRGLHLAYHAKRFCFSGRSKYQKIDIIDNDAYGRMLFLDHNLQHTEYDAEIFNEALCGTAKRNDATRIIVLGGGSGQTLLDLLESPTIAHVTLVDIDQLLIASCRRHIKGVNQAFRDHRVRVVIDNAFSYLHSTTEEFDTAIIDLTESPFEMSNHSTTLNQLYLDIKAKCKGCCSQYLGSSVALAKNRRLINITCSSCRKTLSRVRLDDVFIPSFGAPHTFMHAGYER
jgi:spermidine synthase